jgi:predicted MFS family arabinose efflux permease
LILADTVTRLVGLSTIAALGLLGRLSLPAFVVLLAVSSLLHPWGQGGRAGIVPLLVPEDIRLAGNSFLFTSANAALTIVGPGVGGVLVATVGAAPAIAIDAASFFALLIALASLGLGATQGDFHAEADRRAMRAQLLRGPLAFLLALTVVFYGLYGPFEVALPLYIRTDLHAGPELFGFAWAAFGVGALVGGLVGGAILDVRSRVALMRFSVFVVAGWGIAVLVLAVVPVAGVLLAAIAIGGAIYAPYPSVVTTLQQRVVAPAALPAVATAFVAIAGAVTFTATGVGGPVVASVGPRATLIVSGAATVLLAGAVALFAILRRVSARTR